MSIPRVAQGILEGEGYLFYSFASDELSPLQLTATLDKIPANILDILPSKEVVIAIKLDKGNGVQVIHAHFSGGSAIRRFGSAYHELNFATVTSLNPIVLGKPFLTLESAAHVLQFELVRK